MSQHSNYLHKWLVHLNLTCLLLPCFFFFLCEFTNYAPAWNNILSSLKGWPIRIGILWKWNSMLTQLAWDGECRLARFHAIRNFLTSEMYDFSRLLHQTNCLFTRQLAPYNHAFISHFCLFQLFQNAILHKMLKMKFWNVKPIFLRMQFSFVAAFFFSSFSNLFALIFVSSTVLWVFNICIVQKQPPEVFF